jgi:hypothetical protein
VDENAEALFKERIHALAACLPNVVVVEGLSITHGGHNMTAAYVRCLEALERPDRPWRYVALLQVSLSPYKAKIIG